MSPEGTARVMRLTAFTDLRLRALMHIAGKPGRAFSAGEIEAEFGISRDDHLTKAMAARGRAGILATRRGSGGGAVLARPAATITPGEVVRVLERDQPLVECFRTDGAPVRSRRAAGSGCGSPAPSTRSSPSSTSAPWPIRPWGAQPHERDGKRTNAGRGRRGPRDGAGRGWGPLLGVEPRDVPRLMRHEARCSLHERGKGGCRTLPRHLRHGGTRLRFTCAEDGTVLSRLRAAAGPGSPSAAFSRRG